MHDLLEKEETQLWSIEYRLSREVRGPPQLWKTPQQCVVLLAYDSDNNRPREWVFRICRALFRLVPPRTPVNDAAFTEQRLAFANQPDPERTVDGTAERLIAIGLQSLDSQGVTTTSYAWTHLQPSQHSVQDPASTRNY